ncbi:hypothetical protein [Nocardioides fonticola]|uniref:hypothetical protein n=1 Tax=Nocardioides fonticola TaxID=450363 RepID=UPI0031D68E18
MRSPRLTALLAGAVLSAAPVLPAVPATAAGGGSGASSAVPCPLGLGPAMTLPVTVTPGKGRLRVSWQQPSDWSGISGWQVATVARPMATAPVTWRAVKSAAACTTVSVTLKGLVSGTPYEVWLEADSPDPVIAGAVVTVQVARIAAVTVR